MFRRAITGLALALMLGAAQAATHYIRDGGTASTSGTGACTGWATANACDEFPATLVRGDVYCVADGTYSGKTISTAVSGTSTITIRKAVNGDGTCDQGANWVSTYGDGQATFGTFLIHTNYIVIDGATRNESDWSDGNAYGFKTSSVESTDDFSSVFCATHLTVKYVNLGLVTGTNSADATGIGHVLKGTGYRSPYCLNWTVQRNFLHNVTLACLFCANGFVGALIEYNRFQDAWGKEAIRGQISFGTGIIRFNQFVNACGYVAPEGCTAEIAIWDDCAGGSCDSNQIYGNYFYRSNGDENSGGTIVVGGNGASWVGSPASNTLIYNNTIAGISGGGAGGNILVNGGTGNVCRNNLWYDTITASVTCSTTSNNVVASSDPFVSYATGDLRLSGATAAGTTLSAPYDTDMLGNTRGADGTWDVGAFEYDEGGVGPEAPKNFRLVSFAGWALLVGLLGGMLWRMRHGATAGRGGRGAAGVRPRSVGGPTRDGMAGA